MLQRCIGRCAARARQRRRHAAASGGGMQQYAVAGGGRQQQALAQGAWGSGTCGRTERRGRPVVMAAGRENIGERARVGNRSRVVVVFTNLKHWKMEKKKSSRRWIGLAARRHLALPLRALPARACLV